MKTKNSIIKTDNCDKNNLYGSKLFKSATFFCCVLSVSIWMLLLVFAYSSYEMSKEQDYNNIHLEFVENNNAQEYYYNNYLLNSEKYNELLLKSKPNKTFYSYGIRFDASMQNSNCIDRLYNDGALLEDKTKYEGKKSNTFGFFNETLVRYCNDNEIIATKYPLAIQFMDMQKSDDRFCVNNNGKSIVVAGNGLSVNASQEIMVSERFVKKYGLDATSIVGTYLSYDIDYKDLNFKNFNESLDVDNNSNNTPLNGKRELNYVDYDFGQGLIKIFSNYKIVGVFKDTYLSKNGNADYIVNISSLDFDNLPIMKNSLIVNEYNRSNNATIITYNNINYEKSSEATVQKGLIYPFMLGNNYISACNYIDGAKTNLAPVSMVEMQFKNFKTTRSAYKMYNENISHLQSRAIIAKSFSQKFLKINTLFEVVCSVLVGIILIGFIGCIVFYGKTFRIVLQEKITSSQKEKNTKNHFQYSFREMALIILKSLKKAIFLGVIFAIAIIPISCGALSINNLAINTAITVCLLLVSILLVGIVLFSISYFIKRIIIKNLKGSGEIEY